MKKFFKRHKPKQTTAFNVNMGIKRCDTCENNIRCKECASDIETATNKAIYEFRQGLIDAISKQFKGNWEIPCSSRDKTIQDTISIVYNIIRNYRK